MNYFTYKLPKFTYKLPINNEKEKKEGWGGMGGNKEKK